ncbi:hypothetical protein IWX46DRAFT_609310 [Phyllosticta citricarpa]|uniref:Uncharacterized protein n=1 Tax=Phyllosticta citricarpa TaxID=55181 RepID=A0ABR1LRC9_9PEZI
MGELELTGAVLNALFWQSLACVPQPRLLSELPAASASKGNAGQRRTVLAGAGPETARGRETDSARSRWDRTYPGGWKRG